MLIKHFLKGDKKMSEQTITVTLPNTIYDRINMTAKSASLTSEEVIKQFVILLLPSFESDIPPSQCLSLSKLSLMNDIQLWKVANSRMVNSSQIRLEQLADLQKHRSLTNNEQLELDSLLEEAQQIMLCKAESKRLLSQRGHVIFKSVEH